MSVTQLNIDVKIAGAEEAAAKLQKVEQAADATGKKAEQAGGLFAGFERGVKKLDDAVDAVEKPMRVFNGALDIASIALGVGLAGPLGMVIQQIIDFGPVLLESAKAAGIFARSAEEIAAGIRAIGAQAVSSSEDVTKFYAALARPGGVGAPEQQRAIVERAGVQLGGLRKELADLQAGLTEAIGIQTEARRVIASTTDELTRQVGAIRSREEGDKLRQEREVARAELERAIGLEKTFRTEATNRQNAIDLVTRKTNEALGIQAETQKQATKATVENTKAIESNNAAAEKRRAMLAEIATLQQQERDRVAGLVLAEEKAARARELASTPLALAEGLPTQGPTLMQALGDVIGPGAPAVKTISPLEESLKSLSESAMNLESLGVGALQSFSQAAGQALASLVIDGDKAAGSFKKLAGQVAAGLSAQAFGYSVFLTALGIAATLAPVALGALNPAGLFAGAAAMAGTGLLLGVTARALGASTYGPGQSSQSAAGSAGGAQDRVSSFSAGGGGAQPMQVTVVLGVDEVSNVLVRQSQREARSGSLSTSRLAVA
ncbi:MAG: hypothetical protein QM519_08595 [Bacteroidia bacterium]|nr:hypothetical protein [Bacteroidia bacterium]